jgi:glycerophosphoryl diester phosphodiesterase
VAASGSRAGAGEGIGPLPRRGVAAHRGGALSRPENTLAAFREAARIGAHQIELDVRRSADGELVVIHDESVDRTTDGRGAVADLTLAELRRLDAGSAYGPAFAGERIPTLGEVLDAVPRNVWLNVQIKQGEPIAAAAARLLAERGRTRQAFLACGNAAAREARAVDPRLLICNLVRQRSRRDYLAHAVATGSDFIQLHYLRGPPEPELVADAHAAGMRVNFLAAPEPGGVAALFQAGVDFVLVDDVATALEEARCVGIAPQISRSDRGDPPKRNRS